MESLNIFADQFKFRNSSHTAFSFRAIPFVFPPPLHSVFHSLSQIYSYANVQSPFGPLLSRRHHHPDWRSRYNLTTEPTRIAIPQPILLISQKFLRVLRSCMVGIPFNGSVQKLGRTPSS